MAQEEATKLGNELEKLKKGIDAMLREKEDAMEDALIKQRERCVRYDEHFRHDEHACTPALDQALTE